MKNVVMAGLILWAATLSAEEQPKIWQSTEKEDYTIDREQVFEFTKKPVLTRDGSRVTIRFTSKGYCDVTVVIEKNDGTILRHLASGVLGSNVPDPFQRNSLEQTVVWDGKNDQGRYIDPISDIQVRVSLGLKPRFEKTLFWHPKRRVALRRNPRAVAQPEGVYIYEGGGLESIKLFSHQGKYLRTVYPFPANKIRQVKGVEFHTFADGHSAPLHRGYWNCTYLPGGTGVTHADWGTAARAFAVHDGKIALVPSYGRQADQRLARVATDGTSAGPGLYGPEIKTPYPMHSAAFSPDGKWLYLAGPYKNVQRFTGAHPPHAAWKHGVYRLEYAGNEPPKLWLGNDNKSGKDDNTFRNPSSVCVDREGRVYIADNHNDRVQIFSPEGKLVKSIPVKGPAILQLHHKSRELFCFSWSMSLGSTATGAKPYKVPCVLRVFEPFKSTKPKLQVPIPLQGYRGDTIGTTGGGNGFTDEMPYRATLDSYTEPPTIWMITRDHSARHPWPNFQRFRIEKGKFVPLDDWNAEVVKAITKWEPAGLARQRLHVDHRNGMLYSHEGKMHQLWKIDPASGKVSLVNLPYSTEDMAIDYEGHILLRCDRIIGRYTLDEMREVPFDYGEERRAHWSSMAGHSAFLTSALVLPGNRPAYWFEAGMGVNPKGEIVVHAWNTEPLSKPSRPAGARPRAEKMAARKYTPGIYPGRMRCGEIHIFDRHGKPVGMDIVGKGAAMGHGTLIDPSGDVYFLHKSHRTYKGKAFFPLTGCVIKFKRGKGRFISTGRAEVPLGDRKPAYAPQIDGFWVEDAEWIYPGVGFARHNAPCICWNSRFAIDTFGRSFLPERIRNQVAVLDTNGNLILHVGAYGNVDDGVPLVEDQRFRGTKTRSIGGDEVSLVYANYMATHSDHRLYISDAGNGRIVSVKLGYHTEHKIALKPGKAK